MFVAPDWSPEVEVRGMVEFPYLPPAVREQLMAKLTLLLSSSDGEQKTLKLYRDFPPGLKTPRYFWDPYFGDIAFRYVPPQAGQFKNVFYGSPRPNQMAIFHHLSTMVTDVGIQAGCGWGKSAAALYYGSRFPGRGLVVVPNENKLDEWRKEISYFYKLPPEAIGHVQAAKRKWEEFPVSVAVLNTLALQDFPPEFLEGFAWVAWDEAHLYQTPFMSLAFGRINAVNILLTATPGRGAGRRCMELHCGNTWLIGENAGRPMSATFIYTVSDYHRKFTTSRLMRIRVPASRSYMKLAAKEVRALKSEGRRVLVLGAHVTPLLGICESEGGGFVVGKASFDEHVLPRWPAFREWFMQLPGGSVKAKASKYMEWVKENANPILGTGLTKRQPAGIGMDVSDLDGCVILLPVGNWDHIEQIVGRFKRKPKQDPKFSIIVPDHPDAHSVAATMQAKLESLGFSISTREEKLW